MRIAIVAGEASGDLLGAELIRAVRACRSDIEFYGVGGPKMQAAGCDILEASSALAVRGLTEVLRHLPRLFRLRGQLVRRFAADRPALFIGIDAPDFNLGLEKKLKRRGLRTIHYVSPSVWAWREERIKTIGAAADHVLALFPFEPALYAKAGVAATYVGHPLADRATAVDARGRSGSSRASSPSSRCCRAAGRANWTCTPKCSSAWPASSMRRIPTRTSWCRWSTAKRGCSSRTRCTGWARKSCR
jgi:lipid-A-disaccharide synthase